MKSSGGCVASGGGDCPLEVQIKLVFDENCKNAHSIFFFFLNCFEAHQFANVAFLVFTVPLLVLFPF